MKFSKKIIGLLLALTIVMNPVVSLAVEDNDQTEAEKECADQKPDYDKLMEIWTNAETQNQKAYTEAFDVAKKAHHDYVGCMFDFAEKEILKSDGAEQSGVMSANMMHTGGIPLFSTTIDWMSPEEACISKTELKSIIEKSEPNQMLGPVLQAHSDYREHLRDLNTRFGGGGITTNEDGRQLTGIEALNQKSADITTSERQMELEVESSLLAIDMMFTSLKELRLSFVMHVHLQCALKYLNNYRKALEDLRDVIEPLPGKLENASVS